LARVPGIRAELAPENSAIGGGATPGQAIPTWLIAIADTGMAAVARLEDNGLLLDLRTVLPDEKEALRGKAARKA